MAKSILSRYDGRRHIRGAGLTGLETLCVACNLVCRGIVKENRCMKLSDPQELLIKKLRDGASLRHNLDTGLFRLQDNTTTRTIRSATVESLLRAGVINKSLDGECRLA